MHLAPRFHLPPVQKHPLFALGEDKKQYLCAPNVSKVAEEDIKRRRLVGLLAGLVAGVSYGTNPLFAKPLLESGVPVLVMLFFRYGLSAAILAAWMACRHEAFKVEKRELGQDINPWRV